MLGDYSEDLCSLDHKIVKENEIVGTCSTRRGRMSNEMARKPRRRLVIEWKVRFELIVNSAWGCGVDYSGSGLF
jgi:hypothetical protein